MEVSLVSSGLPNLLPMRNRSKGVLHHSTVLSDLCVRLGDYDKSQMDMTRLQLGCAHEDMVALRYSQDNPSRYIQPGELLLGGDLPITPDLLDTLYNVPEEIKLSWLSSAHDPASEKFRRFRWQIMSQCHALNVRSGRLNITHIRGDYKGFDIHHNLWEFQWTQAELDSHVTMILRHRDRMIREGYKGEE